MTWRTKILLVFVVAASGLIAWFRVRDRLATEAAADTQVEAPDESGEYVVEVEVEAGP